MKLESLPKSKETKARKIVGRGPGSVKHLLVEKMVKNQEVELVLVHGSKVDNHLYIEEFQKGDLTMLVTLLDTLQSI